MADVATAAIQGAQNALDAATAIRDNTNTELDNVGDQRSSPVQGVPGVSPTNAGNDECTGTEYSSSDSSDHEASALLRRAACDPHTRALFSEAQSSAPLPDVLVASVPRASIELSPQIHDLDLLESLLDLHDDGLQVNWPPGVNPLVARQLISRGAAHSARP